MNQNPSLESPVDAEFTPWPRPISAPALGLVKKLLLLVAALVVVNQFLPADGFNVMFNELFTLLLVMSWLGPAGRLLARYSRRRHPEAGTGGAGN